MKFYGMSGVPDFASQAARMRNIGLLEAVCTENLIHVDEVAESPKLAQ